MIHAAIPTTTSINFPPVTPQLHTEDLRETRFEDMDPSLAIAYFFRDRDDFAAFCLQHTRSSPSGGRGAAASGATGEARRVSLFSVENSPPSMAGMADDDDTDDDGRAEGDIEDEYVFI